MSKMKEIASKLLHKFNETTIQTVEKKIAIELQILILLQIEESNTLLKEQNELLKTQISQ